MTNSSLDLSVTGVDYPDGNFAHGATVRVTNRDPLVMPATLEIRYADCSTKRLRMPAESWIQHSETSILVAGTKPVASATIDPDHVLPDRDRSNNQFIPTQR